MHRSMAIVARGLPGRQSVPTRPPDRVFAARVFREESEGQGLRVGIARAQAAPGRDRFRSWIAEGRNAGMSYLQETATARGDPRELLSGARSVVCLAWAHPARPAIAPDGSRVARYAAGRDYHATLRRRAAAVVRRAQDRLGVFRYRICVDSSPIAERSFAAAAGLGWIGKNGCLIDPELGSFLLLAEILTDLDLATDDPIAERCGSCRACLDECPTGAFLEPGLLDAHRCLAYWTIEHRGAIPDAMKEKIGENVFGCDVCQEVCPWNAPLLSASPDAPPTRAEWLRMGPGEWRRRYGATALNRAGRRGVQRNAAASAGAVRERALLPALRRAETIVERGLSDAARWAASRLDS